MYYIGFDIGGSYIKFVLVRKRKILFSGHEERPITFHGLVRLITEKTKFLKSKMKGGNIGGIGFSLPGPLDSKREKVLNSANIRYLNGKAFKKIMGEKLELPIKLEHDVHCFLLTSRILSTARKYKNVFYITLGTGLGGAFMVDRKIIRGSHGSAGEVGNMILDMSKRLDFEDLGSNKFVRRRAGKGTLEIAKLAEAGDKKAKATLAELGENVGIGLANIINVFDPEVIVLSGGISEAKKLIEPYIKEQLKKLVSSPEAQKTKILFTKIGYYGGALGAALLFEKDSL